MYRMAYNEIKRQYLARKRGIMAHQSIRRKASRGMA